VICIEQNFGPHIAQNSALLKYSAGEGLIVQLTRPVWIERQPELLVPVERVARTR